MSEEAKFTLKEVAQASDVPVATIRSWFQRGHLTLGLSDKNVGAGIARRVTLQTAMAIAVTGELVSKFGLHPRRAAIAAAIFSHVGEPDEDTGIGRIPGRLWAGPELTYTVLVILADDFEGSSSTVLRIPRSKKFWDVFGTSLFGQHGAQSAIVVVLDELIHQVRARLNLPPDFENEAPAISQGNG